MPQPISITLDQFASSLERAAAELRYALTGPAATARPDSPDLVDEVRKEAEALLKRLQSRIAEVRSEADRVRRSFSISRALELLALFDVGALSEATALELTIHTDRDHQKRMDYPEELRERLSADELIRTMYPLVSMHFDLCIGGTWVKG